MREGPGHGLRIDLLEMVCAGLLPSTAADPNVGIPDIMSLENNIHAGTKYLRFIRDRYFPDPAMAPLNQTLFSFAVYNADPARIQVLREEATRTGLDPNQSFGNVEHRAARRIGRETLQYVSNIGKYWVAYRLAARHSCRSVPAWRGRRGPVSSSLTPAGGLFNINTP